MKCSARRWGREDEAKTRRPRAGRPTRRATPVVVLALGIAFTPGCRPRGEAPEHQAAAPCRAYAEAFRACMSSMVDRPSAAASPMEAVAALAREAEIATGPRARELQGHCASGVASLKKVCR